MRSVPVVGTLGCCDRHGARDVTEPGGNAQEAAWITAFRVSSCHSPFSSAPRRKLRLHASAPGPWRCVPSLQTLTSLAGPQPRRYSHLRWSGPRQRIFHPAVLCPGLLPLPSPLTTTASDFRTRRTRRRSGPRHGLPIFRQSTLWPMLDQFSGVIIRSSLIST